jgi:transcription elongation factor Elf1
MEPTDLKLGLIAKVARWFWDLLMMPTRVGVMFTNNKQILSRKRDCPNCDVRMKVIATTYSKDGHDYWSYQCNKCGNVFNFNYNRS